jgi:chromosomal replication initiation ATPase DnaA
MKVLPRHVLEAVSVVTSIPIEMICGRARWSEHVEARRLYYHAARDLGMSSTLVGRAIDRDHSTVVEVVRAKRLTEAQKDLLARVKELACQISETKFEALKWDLSKALDRHRAEILERAS